MNNKRQQKSSVGQNPKIPVKMEEVFSGYLYKSPSQSVLLRNQNSWKRRWFVLSKTMHDLYELNFYKDENKLEKSIGKINLYMASMLFLRPDAHPIWPWIQKTFKCPAYCVLFMSLPKREYLFIGQNSDEMNIWFQNIFKAMNTHPRELKVRSLISVDKSTEEVNQQPPVQSERFSVPESFIAQVGIYDYPRNYRSSSVISQTSEDMDEDEEDEINDENKNEEEADGNEYMEMASLMEACSLQNQEALPEFDNDELLPQTEETSSHVKEICLKREELNNNMLFTEKDGKPCVSDWTDVQSSELFQKGDQIMAVNDLSTENLDEVQNFLKRLSKNHVKLTILRQPESRPLNG